MAAAIQRSVKPGDLEAEQQQSSISQDRTSKPNWTARLGTRITDESSHLFKELVHEAVPVHTDGDFVIVITVLRLQKTERRINEFFANRHTHPGAPLGAPPLAPSLSSSQQLGQHCCTTGSSREQMASGSSNKDTTSITVQQAVPALSLLW